jgi:hypothetical protein
MPETDPIPPDAEPSETAESIAVPLAIPDGVDDDDLPKYIFRKKCPRFVGQVRKELYSPIEWIVQAHQTARQESI